jgi:hypothetical protein
MQQTATAPPPAGSARTWEATYPGTADQVRHVRAALRPHGLYLLLTPSTRCGIENGPQSRTAWFRIDYPPSSAAPAPPGRRPRC